MFFFAGLAIGLLVGVGTLIVLKSVSIEGITLEQDIPIYNQDIQVAELKKGVKFNRDQITKACSFTFYLDRHQPQTHESVEMYYSDMKK